MDSAAAETHVRLLAEAQLRRAVLAPRYRWLDEDYEIGGEPPEEEGMLRVRAVLNALHLVGAVSPATARSVLGGFAGALAARGLADPHALLAAVRPDGPAGAGPAGGTSAAGPPDGRYQAIPIGVPLPASRDGDHGTVYLQTLVVAPDRAVIVTSFVSAGRDMAPCPGGAPAQPAFPPFGSAGLTDDRGRRYRLTFSTGEGGWLEAGLLDISPHPPEGTRWLEMPTRPGSAIRISLAEPAAAAGIGSGPVPPMSAGDQLLSAVGETMLGGGPLAGIEATQLADSLAEVTSALIAARALPADSIVPAQLAALCQRRAIEVRGPLAGQARTVRLPGRWASVLSQHRDSQPERQPVAAPVAAVLPEIDGARFVLAGLSTWETQTSLTVFCWGRPPGRGDFWPGRPLSWWARDDAGRWHAGRGGRYNAADGMFQLGFSPPLQPGASALDIVLTGSAARVTVSVPLRWPDEPTGAAG